MFDSFNGGRTAARETYSFYAEDLGGGGGGDVGSDFGAISSYLICAGCGQFHSVIDGGGSGIQNALNADDRGGVAPNGKASLSPTAAGGQIGRANATWGPGLGQAATVTFAFRSSEPGTMPSNGAQGFSRFTDIQIAATLQALASWSDVANITFVRVNDGDGYSNNATILFSNYSSGAAGAAAFASLPGNAGANAAAGDVWVNITQSANQAPGLLNYGQQTLVHEIGHAIGLLHPADYNASAGVTITYNEHAVYYEDSRQYTVMSYFAESNTGGDFIRWVGNTGYRQYASAPLLDDIAAIQRLYGANMTTRTGDTVYGFNSTAGQAWYAPDANGFMIFAVWDAGGNDTFDFSGYSMAQLIDLRQGAFSSVGGLIGNVSIALGAVIENVIGGAGADTIYGNSADNIIRGNGGDDVIDGGMGTDTVVFSGARSSYTITWNGQVGTIVGLGATVTVRNVEWLQFSDQTIAAAPTGGVNIAGDITNDTYSGTAFDDVIRGLGGDDVLNGLGGNDRLEGGAGNDTLNGGDGDDILVGGLGDDILNGGDGWDVADYSRSATGVTVNLATGQATGEGADTLISIEEVRGSTKNDILTGDDGDNILRGGGGADQLFGGGGNDILYAGAPGTSGGAPDIIKPGSTANNSFASAVNLDGAFDLIEDARIVNSTTVPHATIQGVVGAVSDHEYYVFTVRAGDVVTFDIDGASFDTVLTIFDPSGITLATNDDASANDGHGSATDSFLSYTFTAPGTYYIRVSQYALGAATGSGAPAGGTYTLHVSIPSQTPVPLTSVGSLLDGGAGDDVLYGGIGPDTLLGGAGNDRLVGGGGSDTLNGGDGYDVAVYSGAYRGYTTVRVDQVSGGRDGGTDTLSEIEAAEFIDGVVTFNADSIAAQLMRLYSVAFDREPDALGFEIQLNALEAGVGIQELARRFIASEEFTNTYGALTDRQFIDRLYLNAFNREGEASGINSWLVFLANGGSREDLMLIFAESAEHRAVTWSTLAKGLWVGDDDAAAIARLYDAVYDRIPDQEGLITWTQALKGGANLLSIATAFLASAEGLARYGALTNAQFVELAYQSAFGRAGDAEGVAAYLSGLEAGTITRAAMLLEFSQSAEHRALTLPLYVNGIPVAISGAPVVEDIAAVTEGHAKLAEASGVDHDQPQVLPGAEDDIVLATTADDFGGKTQSWLDPQVQPFADDDFVIVAPGEKAGDELLVLPSEEPSLVLAGKGSGDIQVLPGAEDDFVIGKAAYDEPLVLVGEEDDILLSDLAVHEAHTNGFATRGDFALFDPGADLFPGLDSGDASGSDGWGRDWLG